MSEETVKSKSRKKAKEDAEVIVEGVPIDDEPYVAESESSSTEHSTAESASDVDHASPAEAEVSNDENNSGQQNSNGRDRYPRNGKNNNRNKRDQNKFHKKKQNFNRDNNRDSGRDNSGNNNNAGNNHHHNNNNNRRPIRKGTRKELILADGFSVEYDRMVLGDLPEWDVIKDIEDIQGLAEEFKGREPLDFNRYYVLPLPELKSAATEFGLELSPAMVRPQILRAIMEKGMESQCLLKASGVLEILENGHGLLLFDHDHYRLKEYSIFVPQVLIKHYALKRGHSMEVLAHPPRNGETTPYVLKINSVNGISPEEISNLSPFTELVPYYPTDRFLLETSNNVSWDNTSMRIVDLLTPIGLGQRGLIVAPPRTGKTVLMQGMANAIATNRPDVHLIILLIDERPEEVTDFTRNCAGDVFASTFDEAADSHVHVAEMVIEKARRMVESGRDVVILLDSITRLARAYNTMMPNSGKILSGGVEASAMQKPKRFFGSARNIEGGGSLTIVATALVDTGSRMDEVIFEEFKGTGNMELHLDRALVDKRIFPSLSFEKSGTRKEELLYHPDEMNKVYGLRRAMKGVPSTEAMEMLITRVKKTKSNPEFLMAMSR
jgi:transcription termination factor Rho